MAENAVLLNISDMIDLAIGSPEVGVVDFNMLQTVLHCLAQQQRVLDKNVEVRGSLGSLPIPRENVQTIAITEYTVDTDKTTHKTVTPQHSSEDTILVVERVKKTDSPDRGLVPSPHAAGPGVSHTSAGAGAGAGGARAGGAGTGAGAGGAGAPSGERLSLVTISKFNILENTVDDLKNRVYGSMPKNEEILEGVRSQTNIKAITDMWTNLNASARLEAAEAGIAKLSSLVQDLINESTGLQDASERIASKTKLSGPGAASGTQHTAPPGTATPARAAASTQAAGNAAAKNAAADASGAPGAPTAVSTAALATAPGSAVLYGPGGPIGPTKEELIRLQNHVTRLRGDLDHLIQTFYTFMKEQNPEIELPPPPEPAPPISVTTMEVIHPPPSSSVVSADHPRVAQQHSTVSAGGGGSTGYAGSSELSQRVADLEIRIKDCCDRMGHSDGHPTDLLSSFQDQLDALSRQVAGLSLGMPGGALTPDLIKDLQGLVQLFQTVQDMQVQLKNVHDTALQLAAEKEDRRSHLNALLEQIELLKTVKLDREDMAEAMAEKADLRMLARKVSHDQFEMACDDLSRGLEHALGKLNMQEALWQQALDDIQREIETKLDKMELSPVKDFFNNKLKQLQENLKQMASLRREAEAAGTKKKLLRDVNCLSCDANAVMQTEAPSSIPLSKPLPGSLSMKPYLSYELDTIRKNQASNLPQRNMHDWENIEKQMTQPKLPQKVRSGTDKHLCNRYCGGSHTTTTPAQRVARLGHFIKQWGPDVLPLSSGLAAGDDGRMYRVSATEGANVGPGGAVDTTCTLKPTSKPELPESPLEKISEDCKCLEAPPGRSRKS